MSVLYASAAPSAPSGALDLPTGMSLRWVGPDGQVWDLCSRESGVYLMAGTRGLGMPTGTRFRDSSPASHGSQHRGTIWGERSVFWPIKTWHADKGQAFIDRDRAFFDSLDPERPGRWYAGQPNGNERFLELRYEPSTQDEGLDIIPSLTGWARYGIDLVADQPFWVGKPSVQSWEAPRPLDPTFEPDGPHLLNIGQGFTYENAAIDNLGDIESYPRWFVDGETFAGGWVGVGDLRVTLPFTVPAGKCLVIESEPAHIGATMYDVVSPGVKPFERVIGVDMVNPVKMSRELGQADFAAVPPGKSVPLSISFTGSGIVEAYLPSLYRRAW